MSKKIEEMRKMAEGKDKIYERMTKWRTDQICFPRDLNIHDPDHQYVWADETAEVPAWVWVMRALGAFGFMVGIYCLVFLGLLL
jgi:hypothetical protein